MGLFPDQARKLNQAESSQDCGFCYPTQEHSMMAKMIDIKCFFWMQDNLV